MYAVGYFFLGDRLTSNDIPCGVKPVFIFSSDQRWMKDYLTWPWYC